MIYDTAEYSVKVKAYAENGKLIPSVSFEKNGVSVTEGELVFENKMQMNPAHVQWKVRKVLEGNPADSETFSFTLRETDGSFATDRTDGISETITITDSGISYFDSIEYTKVGTYYYVVKEEVGNKGGMTYDSAEYHITVSVTSDENNLTANVNINKLGAGRADELLFTNTYTVSGNTSVTIEGTKTLVGRPMLNGEFKFRLEEVADKNGTAVSEPFTLEAENSAAVNGKAAFTFAPVTYTDIGDYFYRITEIPGVTGNGVTYSDDSCIVKVSVSDNGNGGLTSSWSVAGNDDLAFVNTYKPVDVYTDITAGKKLSGKLLGEGQFTFVLTETDSDFTTVLQGGEYREAKNSATGYIDFGRLTYAAEGDYYYTVRESIPDVAEPGIIYDETEYRITVSVRDDHNGALTAFTSIQMVIDDESGETAIPASSIVFYNEYEVTGSAFAQLTGTKTLTGWTLADDMFTFELYETDSSYSIDGITPETANNKDGGYKFLVEYFPEDIDKTFYYLVKEKNGGRTVDGITYSSKEYRVSIEVKDDGKGGFEFAVTAKDLTVTEGNDGTEIGGMDFVNTYTHESEPATDPKPEPTTEPTTEPKTEPKTEPITAPKAETETASGTETLTAYKTEPTTESEHIHNGGEELSPKTGDTFNIRRCLAFLFVSGVAVITTVTCGKSKKEVEEE